MSSHKLHAAPGEQLEVRYLAQGYFSREHRGKEKAPFLSGHFSGLGNQTFQSQTCFSNLYVMTAPYASLSYS